MDIKYLTSISNFYGLEVRVTKNLAILPLAYSIRDLLLISYLIFQPYFVNSHFWTLQGFLETKSVMHGAFCVLIKSWNHQSFQSYNLKKKSIYF